MTTPTDARRLRAGFRYILLVVVFVSAAIISPRALTNPSVLTNPSPFGGVAAAIIARQGEITLVGTTDNAGDRDIILARYSTIFSAPVETFGDHGKVIIDLGGDEFVTGAAEGEFGKIYIIGDTNVGAGDRDFFVARVFFDGQLDHTFNQTGWRQVGFGDADFANVIAVDPQGRVVVAGYSFQGSIFDIFIWMDRANYDFAMVRLLPNGQIDDSFGDEDGRQMTGFGHHDQATGIAFDASGRIILVGASWAEDNNFSNIAIARYTPDGRLDSSFDGDGRVTRSFGTRYSRPQGVALDSNGRLVISGTASPGHSTFADDGYDNANIAVARFNADSTPDTSFGTNGVAFHDVAGFDDFGRGVAIDADGRILVAAAGGTLSNHTDFALGRYTANGSLDESFGEGGFAMATFIQDGLPAAHSFPRSMAIDPRDHIYLAGASESAVTGDRFLAFARVLPHPSDFALSVGGPLTVRLGRSASTTATLQSLGGFEDGVLVSANGDANGGPRPRGIGVQFNGSSERIQFVPSAGSTLSATMTISATTAVPPGTYTLWLSPVIPQFRDHQISFTVRVTVNAVDIVPVVETFEQVGAIDNHGIANALKTKLNHAQAATDAGDVQLAKTTLGAFKAHVGAQRGKHIALTATIDGVVVSPADVLLKHAQDAIAELAWTK
jgi:uncharacterized delta-60 repeat protein